MGIPSIAVVGGHGVHRLIFLLSYRGVISKGILAISITPPSRHDFAR
jgi:hypothetical protein